MGCASSKYGRVVMLIGDMDISGLMVYLKQVEEEELRDKEQYMNKKAMTTNEFGHKKGCSSRPEFQKQKGHAP